MMKNKKGQLTIYIILFAVSIVVLVIATVVAGLGTRLSSEAYAMGAQMIEDSKDPINGIQNEEIKAEILATLESAQATQQFNIGFTSAMYKYSWVFIILILALVGFLITRRNVQANTGIA